MDLIKALFLGKNHGQNMLQLPDCFASFATYITLYLSPMTTQSASEISLKLTADEALVLFDFLQRFSSTDKLVIEDQSEQRALWNLCCVLEKNLHQVFDVDYKTAIENARNRLRDE